MLYDLINDGDFPDDARVPYRLMRWWLLDCYYTYCHDKIRYQQRWGVGWVPGEQEIAWAYEQYELSYQLPIERLMLEVLALILRAGRGPEQAEAMHRSRVATLLAEHSLESLLATLEDTELKEFTVDLRLLGLL